MSYFLSKSLYSMIAFYASSIFPSNTIKQAIKYQQSNLSKSTSHNKLLLYNNNYPNYMLFLYSAVEILQKLYFLPPDSQAGRSAATTSLKFFPAPMKPRKNEWRSLVVVGKLFKLFVPYEIACAKTRRIADLHSKYVLSVFVKVAYWIR